MKAPPWMLVRLALETTLHHPSADEDRLGAMDIATVADYRAFLLRVYGFEAPVEQAIGRIADLDPALLRSRSKTSLLRHDLMALGATSEELEHVCSFHAIHLRTFAHALGWLYALERHTLVSGLIRRHVLHVLGTTFEGATTYLNAYGTTPGARFRALGETLGRYAQEFPPTVIIAAACEAFRAQRQWYKACPPLRAERAEQPVRAPASRAETDRPHPA